MILHGAELEEDNRNIQYESVFHLQSHEMLNFMLQRETTQLGLRFCLMFSNIVQKFNVQMYKAKRGKWGEGQVKIKEKEEDRAKLNYN